MWATNLEGILIKSDCMLSGQSGQQISDALKIKTWFCAQWSLWARNIKGISIKSAYMFSGQSGQQMSEAL